MSTILDLLSAPEFADGRLTESINIPPYVTGRPAQLGIFTDKPIANTYVQILIQDGELTVIPARERGGPANKNMREARAKVMIPIPHFPLEDAVTPSDLQNLHAYGDNQVMLTLAGVYNDKLVDMRAKHDETSHMLDWGALNGLVVDGEGKVLANLWDTFGITQPTYDLEIGSAATVVAPKTFALKAMIKRALKGQSMNGIRVFAGAEFFDAFISQASVTEAYKFFAAAPGQNPNRDDISDDGFKHGAITIERVDEEFSFRMPDGTLDVLPAVAADEGLAIPMGTQLFRRYVAPPDTIFDANTAPDVASQKVFVATDDLPFGKGRAIHTESNLLPVCVRPQVMVKLTM